MMVDEEVRTYPLQLEATRNGITVAIPWAQRQANGAVIVRLHIQSAKHAAGEILLNDTDVIALDGEERPLRTQVRRVWGYGALADVTPAHLETARFDIGFRLDIGASRGHCGIVLALLRTFLPNEGPRAVGGPWVFRFRVADDEEVAATQRQEAARQEAQRAESARQEAARADASRADAERREAQRLERARMEMERSQRAPQLYGAAERGEEAAAQPERGGQFRRAAELPPNSGARAPRPGDRVGIGREQQARDSEPTVPGERGERDMRVREVVEGMWRGAERATPPPTVPDQQGDRTAVPGAEQQALHDRPRRGPRFLRPEQTPAEDESAAGMLLPVTEALSHAAAPERIAPLQTQTAEAAAAEKPPARRGGRRRSAADTTSPEEVVVPPAIGEDAGSATATPAARRRAGRPRATTPDTLPQGEGAE